MFRDILEQAWTSLRFNRRRSALTMLGMAWGIATVVILLAYGEGFERAIFAFFRTFGTNLIMVFPGRTSLQAGGTKAGTEVRFTLDDVDRIASQVPFVKGISPMVNMETNVQQGNRTIQFPVNGVYPVFGRIRRSIVDDGAFFTEEHDASHARVAVIGDGVKEKLFSGRPAVGESIRISGISFLVIGVMRHKVNGGGDEDDNKQIYVPFHAMGDLKDTHYLNGISIDYEGSDDEKIVKSLRTILGYYHNFKPEDRRAIFVFDLAKDMKEFSVITTGLKVLLAFIGTLTLGIGGVGLMNIMLVSVQQRTREIGVEKALGARKRHILMQFLAEALAITFSGGIAGVLIAYVVSWSVGALTLFSAFNKGAEDYDIRLMIEPSTIMVATLILSLVGLVSGMLPAIRAARLDPIEALRYE